MPKENARKVRAVSAGKRARRKLQRVGAKVSRSSVHQHPRAFHIPLWWLNSVIALFLLPLAWVSTQTFFTCFSRATFAARFLGERRVLVFLARRAALDIAFFGLPRPLWIYVFGHELTHALWVWMMGGRVSKFHVSSDGGHIIIEQAQFVDRARALFFPALLHRDHRALRRARVFLPDGKLPPLALRGHRRDVGVSCFLHALDDPERPDRPHLFRHVFFARRHLFDEPAGPLGFPGDRLAARHLSGPGAGVDGNARIFSDAAVRLFLLARHVL